MSAMSTPPPKPSRHNPPRMPPTGTYSTPPSIWSPNSSAARSTHIRYQDVLGAPAHQVAAIIDGTHLPGGVRPASRFYRSRARRRSRRCSNTPRPWSCRPIPRSMRSPSAWGTLGRNAGGRSRSSREGRSPNRPGPVRPMVLVRETGRDDPDGHILVRRAAAHRHPRRRIRSRRPFARIQGFSWINSWHKSTKRKSAAYHL